MTIWKRVYNIWLLSGIEVNGISPKAHVIDQLAEIFKNPEVKTEKKLATILYRNQVKEDENTTA